MTTAQPLPTGYVLVGVNTSPAAAAATRWAAAEAVRRGAVLYAVHVLPTIATTDELSEARRRVPARVGEWLADAPALPIVAVRVTTGDLADKLRGYARRAAVVALGDSDATSQRDLGHLVSEHCPGLVLVVDEDGRARYVSEDDPVPLSTGVPIVRDVMTSPAVTVRADDLLTEAVRRLDRYEITTVPVVDSEGRLIGVVGEGDVVRRLGQASPRNARVRDAMSCPAWSVTPDEPLLDVAAVFTRSAWKSLPVVLNGRVVGVVSRRDLVRATARHELATSLGASI